MKVLLLMMMCSSFAFASPLVQMNQRIKVYQESGAGICEGGDQVSLDEGLFLDVSCEFNCLNKSKQSERFRGAFIPRQLGLFPGNGSNKENILWSAVGITMKTWSESICLEKAAAGCMGLNKVESSEITEVESGEWRIKSFPGCHDKTVTLSPFNNSIASKRVGQLGQHVSVEKAGFNIKVPLAVFSKTPGKECKKPIKASLCFGDCIDLNGKGSDQYLETLGTQDPLGKEQFVVCGDALANKLAPLNLHSSIRKKLCESYFWDSFLSNDSHLIKSCAALRGEVNCENF